MKSNADYCISHILDPLAEWRSSQVGGSDRRSHVHADNARSHTAKKVTEFLARNGMKRPPHSPYSPDLAPCDFCLFGHIINRLAGTSFEEFDQLLRATAAIFSPLKSQIGRHVSEVDGQIGAMLRGSWCFPRRYVKRLRVIQVLLD
jgi:hypothetical protein